MPPRYSLLDGGEIFGAQVTGSGDESATRVTGTMKSNAIKLECQQARVKARVTGTMKRP